MSALSPQADATQEVPVTELWPATGYRLPRVDLLPPEIRAARRLRRVQQLLAAGLVLVVLVLAVLAVLSRSSASSARADLARAQARSAELQAEQAQYAEASRVQAQLDLVEGARASAMAGDVLWASSLDEISGRAPEGVWLDALTVALAPTATASGAPAAAVDPLAEPAVATITVTGKGGSYQDVAAWLDGLADVPGLADPRYTIATRTAGEPRPVVEFTSTVGVVPDALSHRYDRKDG